MVSRCIQRRRRQALGAGDGDRHVFAASVPWAHVSHVLVDPSEAVPLGYHRGLPTVEPAQVPVVTAPRPTRRAPSLRHYFRHHNAGEVVRSAVCGREQAGTAQTPEGPLAPCRTSAMRGREQMMRQGHTSRPGETPSCARKGGERGRETSRWTSGGKGRPGHVRALDAERFIEQVRGDDPDSTLRIEERELETGGVN